MISFQVDDHYYYGFIGYNSLTTVFLFNLRSFRRDLANPIQSAHLGCILYVFAAYLCLRDDYG